MTIPGFRREARRRPDYSEREMGRWRLATTLGAFGRLHMPIQGPDAMGVSLKEALTAYAERIGPMECSERKVLDRLATDPRASTAFARFDVDAVAAEGILLACIEADRLRSTLKPRFEAERAMLAELDRLDKAVADLRIFVEDDLLGPRDRLAASVNYSPDDVRAMRRGLYMLANLIDSRRSRTLETIPRLGATRKSGGDAPKIAAMRWLEKGVRRNCERASLSDIADLADTMFGGEIDIDQLRALLRIANHSWRQVDRNIRVQKKTANVPR